MTVEFTQAELRKFDRLTLQVSSRYQMERINARFALKNGNPWLESHGIGGLWD